MRDDRLYLEDVLEAADSIGAFLSGVEEAGFTGSDLLRSAVLHKLTVIGEAVARLSEPFRARHPEVPWQDVIGFRNIVVHAYFSVDWRIVWIAATREAPELRQQVFSLLGAEFPGDGPTC